MEVMLGRKVVRRARKVKPTVSTTIRASPGAQMEARSGGKVEARLRARKGATVETVSTGFDLNMGLVMWGGGK